LATHPSPYHRLGFSLAVRNIVKLHEFRAILPLSIAELVEKSIICLRLAEEDDLAMGTSESMADALLVQILYSLLVLRLNSFSLTSASLN
jgi:hypothetical protein